MGREERVGRKESGTVEIEEGKKRGRMETGLGKGKKEGGIKDRIGKNEKGEKVAYDTSKNTCAVVKVCFHSLPTRVHILAQVQGGEGRSMGQIPHVQEMEVHTLACTVTCQPA